MASTEIGGGEGFTASISMMERKIFRYQMFRCVHLLIQPDTNETTSVNYTLITLQSQAELNTVL